MIWVSDDSSISSAISLKPTMSEKNTTSRLRWEDRRAARPDSMAWRRLGETYLASW